MREKNVIQSFEDAGRLFENVHLELQGLSRTCGVRHHESSRRFETLEKAIAELAEEQRELRVDVRDLQAAVKSLQAAARAAAADARGLRDEIQALRLGLDRLDLELRAEIDQFRFEVENRFENIEKSLEGFRLELKSHQLELSRLKSDHETLSVSVEQLRLEMLSEFARLEGKMDEGFSRLENKIDEEVSRLEDKMDEEVSRLEGKMDGGFARLERKMDEEVSRLEGKMDGGFARLERKMDEEVSRLEGKMDGGFARLERKIGQVGNSIGAFVEEISIPSLERIITSKHPVEFKAPFAFCDADLTPRELDAFAVTRPEQGSSEPLEAFVFEIKRKYKDKHIRQIRDSVAALRKAVPKLRECPIYVYLLAASISKEQQRKVWNSGIHLITYGSTIFELSVPPSTFEFDYEIGIAKKSADGSRHRREVPGPHPPFFLMQLELARGTMKSDKFH